MIDIALLKQSIPILLHGAVTSLIVAASSCLFGFIVGTFLGIIQTGKNKFLRSLVFLYVTIIRGTPMLIHILIAFYVLPQLGINIPALWSAVIAIGLNSSAYISQIVKAGIASINKGQVEAARILGFTQAQTMRYIILPQAFRMVLPALGNELVTLVKDSSLASTIGVAELTYEGSIIKSRTLDAFTVYCGVALIYLMITTILSSIMALLERKLNNHANH